MRDGASRVAPAVRDRGLEALDRVVRLAATVLHTPAGAAVVLDGEELLVRSRRSTGSPLRQGTFDIPKRFCDRVIDGNRPLTVDGREETLDTESAGQEWVAAAGVPLRSCVGGLIGALTVFDREPRDWGHQELTILEDLAATAMATIDSAFDIADPAEGGLSDRAVNILERVTDLFYAVDRDWRITYANSRACEHFGYARSELIGRSIWDVVPQAVDTIIHDEYHRAVAEGVPISLVAESLVHPGRWHEVKAFPASDGLSVYGREVTEERIAQQALRESEQFTRTVIESLDEGVVVCDRELDIRAWNPAMEQLTGLAEEDVLGRTYTDALPVFEGVSGEYMVEILERSLDGESSVTPPLRYAYPDTQKSGWVIGSTMPHRSSRDEIIGVITVVRDITEQREAELALKESRQRFRHLFEHAADAIFLHDDEGVIVDVNRRACEALGYTRDELLGMHVSAIEVMPATEWTPEVRDRMERGERVTIQGRHRRKDGSEFPIEVSVSGIDVDGRRLKLALARDITERKRAEQRIRFQARLLDEVGEIVIATDLDGTIIYWNRTAEELLGWSAEEALGRPAAELLAEDPQDSELPETLDLVARGERRSEEVNTRTRSGELLPTYVHASAVHDRDGTVVGMVAVAADLTARKRLEAQLRQMQKMEAVGQLAGGVAHDFNNVLTTITGCTQLVLDELPPDAPARNELAEIEKAAERAAGLTRQLLAFSRKQVLQPRVVELGHVIRHLSRMLRRLIGEHIELALELPTDPHRVEFDPTQIEQVITNLAVNARDAMPDGGRLTVAVDRVEVDAAAAEPRGVDPGEFVVLTVTDTGIGMNQETLSRVFEPFFTTKEDDHGTGLGLSTVYGLVRQSGGHIEADSEPGSGSTFRVYLPASERPTTPETEAGGDGRRGGSGETILVAEDDTQVRSLVCKTLEKRGYSVLSAPDGRTALDLWEANRDEIDLVLTDVVMPRMTGRDLHDRLRERGFDRILFMSGYTDDDALLRQVRDTDVPFLDKPFTPADLTEKVRAVLDAGSAGSD